MNAMHGIVKPRPDGARMQCGGPMACPVCLVEQASYDAEKLLHAAERRDRALALMLEAIAIQTGIRLEVPQDGPLQNFEPMASELFVQAKFMMRDALGDGPLP